MLLGDAKCFVDPPADRPEMYFLLILLLWRYEITSERRRAREKISLGAYSESFIFVTTVLPLGVFLHLLKIKTSLRGVGSLDSISSVCGNSVGIWLLATSCFPKLSQQVFTLFPAMLHESLLSPFPPIFNSFSSCLGWEGRGLDCCVQGCFCCCSLWSWMMEDEELAWCESRKWWLGQATTKVYVVGRRDISCYFAGCWNHIFL